MKVIEADRLSKCYTPGKKALDQVSLSLEEGEVFGFLGPNGAGKTTAIKLLNGMLAPTEGSCAVLGIDPAAKPEEAHRHCGVVTEHAQMYDNLTGLQNLGFYGALFGLPPAEANRRARRLLEELGLAEAGDKKLAAYSTGMRQCLSLARAMIHNPKILFLDEPTSGLDPESAQRVNRMIRALAEERGATVFLCTHQLRYAQEICDSYGLIDQGVLLAAGDIDRLRALVSTDLTVTVHADRVPPEYGAGREGVWEIQIPAEEEIPQMVRRIVEGGGRIRHVSARRLSLEEIYFALLERRQGNKEEAQ